MSRSLAFFRVEGTLINRPTVATAAWIALQAQEMSSRLLRLGNVAMAIPMRSGLGPLGNADVGARATFMGLRGISDDRIAVLGKEYGEKYLVPNILEVGQELISEARKQRRTPVLLSDNLEVVIRPLAEKLGVEHVLANKLEFRDYRATGRLLDPVIHAQTAARWAKAFAAEQETELDLCAVYAARNDDQLLLQSVGHPCSVRPDRKLRQLAKDMDWPVVER